MMQVTVTGLTELKRGLDRLSGDQQTAVVKQAFVRGATTFQQTAIALCPMKTGELKNSIKQKTTVRKGNVSTRVGIMGGGARYKGKVFYGSFCEYGFFAGKRTTLSKVYDSKTKHTGRRWIEGKHFMRTTSEQHKSDVPTQIVNDIAAGIERIAK